MKAAHTIKAIIEEKVCPVHDVHPIVDIIGNQIEITCCCTYFHKYCIIEAEHLLVKADLSQVCVIEH